MTIRDRLLASGALGAASGLAIAVGAMTMLAAPGHARGDIQGQARAARHPAVLATTDAPIPGSAAKTPAA